MRKIIMEEISLTGTIEKFYSSPPFINSYNTKFTHITPGKIKKHSFSRLALTLHVNILP
jgi:hypothetical protein